MKLPNWLLESKKGVAGEGLIGCDGWMWMLLIKESEAWHKQSEWM